MKTSKYLKTIAFCALMLAAAMPGKAQVFPNTYINIDWQEIGRASCRERV